MPVTMETLRELLDPEEPDYDFASMVGSDALPFLDTLVRGPEPMLASKAAYLAGLIGGPGSADVVAMAARSDDAIVRIAAAGVAGKLSDAEASDILIPLLTDSDEGVRVNALKSIPDSATDELRTTVQNLAAQADDTAEGALSASVFRRIDQGGAAQPPDDSAAVTGEMPGFPAPGAAPAQGPSSDPGEMPGLPADADLGEMPGFPAGAGLGDGPNSGLGEMPGFADGESPAGPAPSGPAQSGAAPAGDGEMPGFPPDHGEMPK